MNAKPKTAPPQETEAQRLADALTCAALEMIDCDGLTEHQKNQAEQIYGLASSLESELKGEG